MIEDIDRRERGRRRLQEAVAAEWEGQRITGEATELSQDSIFVEAASPPPADAEVQITLGSGAEVIRLPCRVRRITGGGFAGEFEALSAEQRGALAKLLAHLPY